MTLFLFASECGDEYYTKDFCQVETPLDQISAIKLESDTCNDHDDSAFSRNSLNNSPLHGGHADTIRPYISIIPQCTGMDRLLKKTCPLCGKLFLTPTDLGRHMTVHTGAKPFSCDICEKRFTRKASAVKHMAAVHKIMPT